jgi:hypothetical protein
MKPKRMVYQSSRIIRCDAGKAEKAEAPKTVTKYLADDLTIIAFKLLSLKSGYNYVVSWTYR